MTCEHAWQCVSAYDNPKSWCARCGAIRNGDLGDITECDAVERLRAALAGAEARAEKAEAQLRAEARDAAPEKPAEPSPFKFEIPPDEAPIGPYDNDPE
jgi:hypothetical protein